MRAAVIGLGIGTTHAEVYDRRPEITSIALCDRDPVKLAAVAATLRTPVTCFTDLPALFASGPIDCASIVTPDPFHREHAEAAFAAGAEVLITKPVATHLADAHAIAAAAQRSGRRCMVAHERRFRPSYRRAHELITSGALGDIAYVRLEMLQYAHHKFTRAPWYADAGSGRTAITGSGIHQVDLLRWLSQQEVVRARALGNRIGDIAFHGAKTVVALCEMSAGAIGEVVFTYEATPPLGVEDLTVIGSAGMIERGRFCGRDGREEVLPRKNENMISGSIAAVDAFVDALVAGGPMPVTVDEAIRSLATALAIDEACATGTAVVPAAA